MTRLCTSISECLTLNHINHAAELIKSSREVGMCRQKKLGRLQVKGFWVFVANLEELIMNKEALRFLNSNLYQMQKGKVQVDTVTLLSQFTF